MGRETTSSMSPLGSSQWSLYLIVCDLLLWGYVKDKVQSIKVAGAIIDEDMIRRAWWEFDYPMSSGFWLVFLGDRTSSHNIMNMSWSESEFGENGILSIDSNFIKNHVAFRQNLLNFEVNPFPVPGAVCLPVPRFQQLRLFSEVVDYKYMQSWGNPSAHLASERKP